MQAYFGKVLAGEITKPGSYSRRTVKILGSLDQNTANHFLRLCSISMKLQHIVVPSLGGDARNNVLKEYGLDFATLNLLNEHGLVISVYNSQLDICALSSSSCSSSGLRTAGNMYTFELPRKALDFNADIQKRDWQRKLE